MKLYNRTACPDRILRPLLVAAGRAVRAKTTGVVVKITQARYPRSRGQAVLAYQVNHRLLLSRKWGRKWGERQIKTQGGYILITLPRSHPACDPLDLAQSFYEMALHEWGHIRDFQSCRTMAWSGGDGRRRPRWKERPEEIRACNYADEATEKEVAGQLTPRDDLILELALWLEERGGGRKTQNHSPVQSPGSENGG